MATIYLFRHGQASFGSDDYDRLSPLGQRQAALLGEYLRECGITLDASYSGDLLRQRQTAELGVASQAQPPAHTVDSRFNEINNDEQIEYLLPAAIDANPGLRTIVERGLSSSKDYQKVIDAVFNYWVSPQCDEPRIQSWADYSQGAREAIEELMAKEGSGKTVGVFTSGGTIATIVAQVLGLTGAQTYQFYEPIFNCSVTQVFYSGNRTSLSYFNDRSWLQVASARAGENLVTYR
jgi:broad specificity phosphatase PhoE